MPIFPTYFAYAASTDTAMDQPIYFSEGPALAGLALRVPAICAAWISKMGWIVSRDDAISLESGRK